MEKMTKESIFQKEADSRPAFMAWAPGNYIGMCDECHQLYVGDKRARHCADCAYACIKEGLALVDLSYITGVSAQTTINKVLITFKTPEKAKQFAVELRRQRPGVVKHG